MRTCDDRPISIEHCLAISWSWALRALILLAPIARAAADDRVDYQTQVKPILKARCYACHGALRQKAGLRVDTAKAIFDGGESGPSVVASSGAESLLIERLKASATERMPPPSEGEGLSREQIAIMESWINQGGHAPSNEKPEADPGEHWAFRKLERKSPTIATASPEQPPFNPIDAILGSRQTEHGLVPSPPADPASLIRRLYIDLTGLLPSAREVSAFVADPSDRSYQAIVDRLLASPRYGERWGRHWMDVWRYSDWDGYGKEVRESQPHIWRWRDWIVQSLNRDTPYDQMIVAMLAADENAPSDEGDLPATGFLVRNWYKFNRNVWMENAVEHTSKAFLGLTINCAKCHDHKYDPILQTDYYAFRAIFEPHFVRTDPLPGQPDTTKDGLVRVFDREPAAPTFLFQRGDERRPVKEKPLTPALPQVLVRYASFPAVTPVALPPEAYYPGLNPCVRDNLVAKAQRNLKAKQASVQQAEDRLAKARDTAEADKACTTLAAAKAGLEADQAELDTTHARIAADIARYAQPPAKDADKLAIVAARLEKKRDLLRAKEAVLQAELAASNAKDAKAKTAAAASLTKAQAALETARQAKSQEGPTYAPLTPIYAKTSTGRRLALARWITSPDNPLTARVAVNQIWMRHMGTPLVATVFDFGRNGTPPAIPELLDWLATRLQDENWCMKPIHRLIVTSATYRRQSTSASPQNLNLSRDPANVYYWRMNPKRMESEAVRDNLLHVAGSLSQQMGGPDLDPQSGLTEARRSLYFRHAKEKRVTFLRLFDSADVSSCYRRAESVVPQQALALANSSLCREQARLLTARLDRDQPQSTRAAFTTTAFERILSRPPTADELTLCEQFLESQAAQLAHPARLTAFAEGPASQVPPAANPECRAREDLIHALMNHNDFVTTR